MSGISDESNQSWPNCWYSQTAIKVTVDDVYHALPEIRPSAMREIFLEMPKVHWSILGTRRIETETN